MHCLHWLWIRHQIWHQKTLFLLCEVRYWIKREKICKKKLKNGKKALFSVKIILHFHKKPAWNVKTFSPHPQHERSIKEGRISGSTAFLWEISCPSGIFGPYGRTLPNVYCLGPTIIVRIHGMPLNVSKNEKITKVFLALKTFCGKNKP